MNRSIFTAILIFIFFPVFGTAFAQPTNDQLTEINDQRLQQSRIGMTILGSWAAGSIVAGGIGMTQTSGSDRYFHEMNVAWNAVNLTIAGFGYFGSMKNPASFTLSETIREYQSYQNILLFNAGLDIGYAAFGAYLWERGIRNNSDRSIGYGQSLILQGAFLFVFDVILYVASRSESNQLINSLDGISISDSGAGFQIRF